MTDIAIRVENLSKLYHIGQLHQRPDTTSTMLSAGLRDALSGLFRRDKQNDHSPHDDTDLWALKDVSFKASSECNRRVKRYSRGTQNRHQSYDHQSRCQSGKQ